MVGRVNRRGWIVLESIASNDGQRCVDFFEDPEHGYGFEHFRTDAEDEGRWTPVGNFGTARYVSPTEAVEAATRHVAWLGSDCRATQSLRAWLAYLEAPAPCIEAESHDEAPNPT